MGKNKKCMLEMQNLYFSNVKLNFEGRMNDSPLKETLTVNHAKREDDDYQVKVQIDLLLENEEVNFKLELQTLGFFKLNRTPDIPDEFAKEILLKNTVAIMLPFIRSQVSLLTTQPGMKPIMLQPMDVNQLFDKKNL